MEASPAAAPTTDVATTTTNNLQVLTCSDLPRSVYQCDSCGSDSTRVPRLRCAVCDDFDLCLDCAGPGGAAARHGHPYRVCIATRYPLFPRSADTSNSTSNTSTTTTTVVDDPKNVWTIEEDLRLLRGIQTHGLGNWPDIAVEVVAGPGSTGKTAKRCMERYLDDYLGRYGSILPPFMLVEKEEGGGGAENTTKLTTPVANTAEEAVEDPMDARSSTRRSTILRNSPVVTSPPAAARKKQYTAIPTPTTIAWPLPSTTGKRGQEVGRDVAVRAEQAFCRALASTNDPQQLAHIRHEWKRTRLNQPGGPTALPMKPTQVDVLPGSEIAGYMPRRGDFDLEWENDAEDAIADMEFTPGEPPADKELKLQVLRMYNTKLDAREQRKQFVISRRLLDLKQRQVEFEKLPRDERDLVHRMRLFERFHTPAEHKEFIDKLLKAKRLRKEIAKLQLYRRIGIRTLEEAERYELDKARRQFHKQQSSNARASDSSAVTGGPYWKQYKTSDRKIRKSVNRASSSSSTLPAKATTEVELKTDETTKEDVLVGEAGVVTKDAPSDETKKPAPEAMDTTAPPVDDNAPTEPKEPAALPQVYDNGPTPMDVDEENKKTETSPPLDENPTTTTEQQQQQEPDPAHHILLSDREKDLCQSVDLQPHQYLQIKRALIAESLAAGLVEDSKKPGRTPKKLGAGIQRSLVQLDVERKGTVVEFVVRAGWIPAPVGQQHLEQQEAVSETTTVAPN